MSSRSLRPRAHRRAPAGPRGAFILGLVAAVAVAVAVPGPASAQDWRTMTLTRRTAGQDHLSIDLQYGAGDLSIHPVNDDVLYRAMIRYDADRYEPLTDYHDGTLSIGIRGGKGINIHNQDAGRLDLGLGTGVPLDLDLKFGAVEANLDLGGLRVRSATIETGASETTVRFSTPNPETLSSLELSIGAASFKAYDLGNANVDRMVVNGGVADVDLDMGGAWQRDMTAEVKMGMGSVSFRVPRDVGVRVHKSGFLASFDASDFNRSGDDYISSNWDRAKRHLKLEIDSAFGSINVGWLPAATVSGGGRTDARP
jgi:N-terminal domain of toast_rack, DUF2154